MVDINPFQAGQQFEVQQTAREQLLLERQRREEGINALAGMFGPTALAPAERASVFGTERAERALTASEEQRVLQNQRQEIIDQRTAEEADLKRRTGAALNVVGLFEQGIKNNVPIEILAQTAGPTLQAIGVSDEETSAIIQRISEDPETILPQIRAALMASQKQQPRGQVGRLVPAVVSGKDVFIRGLPGGGIETIEGATPITPTIQRERLDIARERIDPTRRGEIKEEEVIGGVRGEIFAADLPTSRTEIAAQRSKIRSMRSTTDRALNALESATGKVGTLSTGFIGGVSSFIPGTPGFTLVERLLPVVSQEFVTNLQNMRDLSKTGGAVGNVSNAEGDKLQAINASLNIGVGKEQLLEQMKIMREAILTSRRNIEQAFEDDQAARKVRKDKPKRFIFNPATGLLEPK